MDFAKLSDKALVELFLKRTEDFSGPAIRERVDGVTEYDVSRWRRGSFKRLNPAKRAAVEAFLRESVWGAAAERTRETLEGHAHAWQTFFAEHSGWTDDDLAALLAEPQFGISPSAVDVARWRDLSRALVEDPPLTQQGGVSTEVRRDIERFSHLLWRQDQKGASSAGTREWDDLATSAHEREGQVEETPEQAAALVLPDVSYLKPTAKAFYERTVGSWVIRKWPWETVERAAREFVAPIKGYSVLRKQGQGYKELSDEDQMLVLEGQAEDIEEVYGPDGILRRR